MPEPRNANSRYLTPTPAEVVGGAIASAIFDPTAENGEGVYNTFGEALAAVKLLTPFNKHGVLVIRKNDLIAANIAAEDYDFEARIGLMAPAGMIGNVTRPTLTFDDGARLVNLNWINSVNIVGTCIANSLFNYTSFGISNLFTEFSIFQLGATSTKPLIDVDGTAALILSLNRRGALLNASAAAKVVQVGATASLTLVASGASVIPADSLGATAGATINIARGADCPLSIDQDVSAAGAFKVATERLWQQSLTVVTANYQAHAQEIVRYDSSGGTFTVDLPQTAADAETGTEVIIANNTSDATEITLRPYNGVGSIGGSATIEIAGDGAVVRLISIAGTGLWLVVSDTSGGGGGSLSTMLFWGVDTVDATTADKYLLPGYHMGAAHTVQINQRMAMAGTISQLGIIHNTPAGNGNDIVYTILVNGVKPVSGPTVTLASDGTTATDIVNTVDVVAGDQVALLVEKALNIGSGAVDVTATCLVS